MLKTKLQSKFAVVSTATVMTLALGFSSTASAGSVVYADPVPAGASYPGCLPDLGGTPTGNDGGISYEWTVKLGRKDEASFVNKVGAKSFNEPPPAYEPPDTGWTHTSNWVALELSHGGKVKIEVERQEGVMFTNVDKTTNPWTVTNVTARNKLVPAIAVFSGIDNTSCEDHRYNTAGNVDWNTLQYIGNAPNNKGRSVAVYEGYLPAGQYSIAIGGSPKVLPDYSILTGCNPVDPVCYAYTGNHGYRATIKTGH